MLVGTGEPESLAHGAASLERFDAEPARLEGVETFHLFSEIASAGVEALLPPGLHPTLPPAVTWIVQRVAASPWGPFALAQCRLECRSGLRPRGFLRGAVIDGPRAAEALAAGWGYGAEPGSVELSRGYDRVRARVSLHGTEILALLLRDPVPLGARDVQIVANVNLVRSPRGLRLLQVDPEWTFERVERGAAAVERFDAGVWGCPGARPTRPVAAVLGVGTVTLPKLRYACRPDVLAFYGTERLGG